ncbi:MFS transporter [Pseudonocardiaceae bacterium YIM PH 21723]|nr:MFS transporter [Pseudonocardiaceae bacterium YIM PH 21723]
MTETAENSGLVVRMLDDQDRRGGRRELTAATVGGVVEAYDWGVYAVLAPYFAPQLFPSVDEYGALISAYLTFAAGFIARPFGAVIIGRLTDTRGRRFGLTLSVTIIAAASLLLAVVPTNASIGPLAAVIVIAARLAQGLSMGAENPSAGAYVTETAPHGRRFLYSAISYTGIVFGSLLAFGTLAILQATLGDSGVTNGGWRIAFVFGAVLGLAALWIRRGIPESEAFEQVKPVDRRFPFALLKAHRRELGIVLGACTAATIPFYFGTIYLPIYSEMVGATTRQEATRSMLVALVVLLITMAAGGALADRIGALRALRIGCAAIAGITVPLMMLLQYQVLPFTLVASLFLMLFALPVGVANVLLGSLFPPEIRTVGVALPSAIAIGVFGGSFPAVAHSMAAAGHVTLVPWIVTLAGLGGLVATVFIRPDRLF